MIKKVNFNGEINSNLFIFFVAIILLISPSLLINVLSNKKFNILTFLLGPYLCTSLLVQTGQLNNRSPNIKIAINNLDQSKLIDNSQIFVLSPNELDSEELSEIIKISLYSKNIIKKLMI